MKLRTKVGLIAATTVAAAGTFLPVSTATATVWDPHVRLQGSAICTINGATWVWVEASNGERGWATNGTGKYSFDFWRVPTSGMTVKVNYGNGTFACTDTFGVNRPAFGATATRNVIQIIPNA